MEIIKENYNYRQILHLIVANQGMSRAQIARETNLNRSTISYVVNYFMENNLVFETEEKVLTGGRASNLIKFNYKIYEIMLIDLQKKKQKIFICDLQGNITEYFDFKIDHNDENILLNIKKNTEQVLKKYPAVKSCGLAIHGIVSTIKKEIHSPFYAYDYVLLEELFTTIGLNFYIENEANIYTNGIYNLISEQTPNLINIHIKHGIGSGLILNGSLHRGDKGYAGEIGHSISVPGGLQCECGNKGCLELYCSEQAFQQSIELIINEEFDIEKINYYLNSYPAVKKLYDKVINLLAIKLNDLILFTDVSTIYISSNLFNEIKHFKYDLLNQLKLNTYIEPNIHIISADIQMFTAGYSNIIMCKQFGFTN